MDLVERHCLCSKLFESPAGLLANRREKNTHNSTQNENDASPHKNQSQYGQNRMGISRWLSIELLRLITCLTFTLNRLLS